MNKLKSTLITMKHCMDRLLVGLLLWIGAKYSIAFSTIRSVTSRSHYSRDFLVGTAAQPNDIHQANDEADDENDSTTQQISRIEAIRKLLRTESQPENSKLERRDLVINLVAAGLLGVCGVAASQLFMTSVYTPSGFQRFPQTQFIAALGDPKASEGVIDQPWGVWRLDPGPRGVWLKDYESKLQRNGNEAPAGWTFSPNDWWLEEHGLIMETPTFPVPPGRYLVTGGRSVTTALTISPNGRWKLDQGTLYDVTHLPCRAARYKGGSPAFANTQDFPVAPGAIMPAVPGAVKQDYAVLFLVGKAAD